MKLRRAGYKRTIQGLYHVMRRIGIYEKARSKAKKPQAPEVPVEKYLGERVQIDEKYVPKECMSKELKEARKRYTYFTKEHSIYELTKFLEKVIKYYEFKIKLL